MLETLSPAELLNLTAEFPPISTAEWEAVIRKDLKGADYDKKLVWRPEDGIAVRPYYRSENLAGLGEAPELAPGEFPYTRGAGHPWEEAQDWLPPAGSIRADHLHEAGASTVQELGFALAEAVEKLRAAVAEGKNAAAAAPETLFVYAAGPNYFFEIAKLRAVRLLWSQAVAAFCDDPQAAVTRVHVRTGRLNKSLLDPYTNVLRVTTEALSAVIGGCDSLSVEPFGFDPHTALNVQRILREEVQLGRVSDPAGGSYYVESLTYSLAHEAWRLFQQVEAAGGWAAALASGMVAAALSKSREAKAKGISSRRSSLVGVNNYPNAKEKTLEHSAPAPLPGDHFPQQRLAEPFENIRRRTAQHAQASGKYPKLLLLKRGDLKMKTARANFCLNFFGCAGFDIVESEDFAGTDADLIVLCSSDPEYVAFANEVCQASAVPVLVAGNPKDQIGQLEAAGVQGFIHVLSNAVDTLTEWQNRLGMSPLSPSVSAQ